VVGIIDTGFDEVDRSIAEVPLAWFAQVFAMGDHGHSVVMRVTDFATVPQQVTRLGEVLAAEADLVVLDWDALQPGLRQAIASDMTSAWFMYGVLIILVAFSVLNTQLMSVLERTREFGMLMAIGMRAPLVGRMLWLELILLALIGTVAGIILGGGLALWYAHAGIAVGAFEGLMAQWGLPGRLYPTLSATSALAGPAVIVVSVAVAGLFPMRRIRRLEPVKAMRAA
jgi:ABC-type lipoprotein release transport system permease subunit